MIYRLTGIALVFLLLLLGSWGQTRGQSSFKYVGNNLTLIFHRPWCPYAKVMNPSKMEFFPLRKDAVAAGYRTCRYCLPTIVLRVGAVLKVPLPESDQEEKAQDLRAPPGPPL